MDADFNPLWREVLEGEHAAHSIFKLDPLEKDLFNPRRKDSLELDNVTLNKTIGRVGGSEGQISVISKQN
jgi:hypothetical protein